MKVTVDTNILVRAVVQDDRTQGQVAAKLLQEAEAIVVPLPCLCELVWVLGRVYGFSPTDVSASLRALLAAGNVVVDRLAAEAGLAVLDAGGDLADGLIAYEGNRLGGQVFASFDRHAVALIAKQGFQTLLPV